MQTRVFRASAKGVPLPPGFTGRRSDRPFVAGLPSPKLSGQDLIAQQEAAARFGHRFGLDLPSSSPPVQRVKTTEEVQESDGMEIEQPTTETGQPATKIEQQPTETGQPSMEIEQPTEETEQPRMEDFAQRAGKALETVMKGQELPPGGKINSILDVIHLMKDFHSLHGKFTGEASEEQSGTPSLESQDQSTASEKPSETPSSKPVKKEAGEEEQKKEQKQKEEEKEDEEEERPETSLAITGQHTKSPYTHNTALHFKNLAQSYVLGVGAYEPNRKKDKKSVRDYLGQIPKTIRSKMLHLVSATSYDEFLKELKTEEPQEKKTEGPQEEKQDEIRSKIWSISQLMDLEAARRRAGGVMNALGLKMDLAKGEVTETDVGKRLIDKNVMSHSMASGKSQESSEGKLERLQKSKQVLLELMKTGGDQDLAEVKTQVGLFAQSVLDTENFASAAKDWKKQASPESGKLNLHIGRKLEGTDHLSNLKKTAEYTTLKERFGKFMRVFYGLQEPSKTDGPIATQSNSPIDFGKKENNLKDNLFLTWLINKAASEGHQEVLNEVSDQHTYVDPEHSQSKHEVKEFHDMFKANEHPGKAKKVNHIANLRRGYQIAKDSNIFGGFRMHANNPGQHFHPGFGKYETLQEEVISPLESLYGKEESKKEIRRFLDATTNEEFLQTFTALEQKTKEYPDRYKREEDALWTKHGGTIRKGTKGARQQNQKLINAFAKANDKLPNGIEEIMDWIKGLDKNSSMLPPNKVKAAANKLDAARIVYRVLETARDPSAGAFNELVREFAVKKTGDTLSPQELLFDYNIMSPVGVNTDPKKKAEQYERVQQDLRPSTKVKGHRNPAKKDSWKDEDLQDVLHKKLKGN